MTTYTALIRHGGNFSIFEATISGGSYIKNIWHARDEKILEALLSAPSELVYKANGYGILKFRAADFPFDNYGIDSSKIHDCDTIWAEILDEN